MNRPFSLERFRTKKPDPNTPGMKAIAAAARSFRQTAPKRKFVKFPLDWIARLGTAKRISTYRVALHLLYQDWRTNGKPITLSNVALRAARVSAWEKWRALAELETGGLIEVERRPQKSPIVKILGACSRM
jgi:hypothetical protein